MSRYQAAMLAFIAFLYGWLACLLCIALLS